VQEIPRVKGVTLSSKGRSPSGIFWDRRGRGEEGEAYEFFKRVRNGPADKLLARVEGNAKRDGLN